MPALASAYLSTSTVVSVHWYAVVCWVPFSFVTRVNKILSSVSHDRGAGSGWIGALTLNMSAYLGKVAEVKGSFFGVVQWMDFQSQQLRYDDKSRIG